MGTPVNLDPILRQAPISAAMRRLGPRPGPSTTSSLPFDTQNAKASESPDEALPETLPAGLSEVEIEQCALVLAKRMLDAERGAALASATEQGLALGKAQGMATAQKHFADIRLRIDALLARCEERLDEQVQISESAAIQIAIAAVGKILGGGLAPAQIEGLIRQAAAQIRHSARVVIQVSQVDFAALEQAGIHPNNLGLNAGEVLLQAASEVDAGGCVLLTEHGDFDARLDAQMQVLGTVLRRHYHSRTPPEHLDVPT